MHGNILQCYPVMFPRQVMLPSGYVIYLVLPVLSVLHATKETWTFFAFQLLVRTRQNLQRYSEDSNYARFVIQHKLIKHFAFRTSKISFWSFGNCRLVSLWRRVGYLSVAWPTGVQLLVFCCSSVPVMLFDTPGISRCRSQHISVESSSLLHHSIYL